MKQIANTYNKNSFTFNLIERDQDVAIYEQIEPETGKRIAYEVFEVMKKQAVILHGNAIEAHESCPSNEQWGNYGFTVYDLKDAKDKQVQLIQKIEKRQISVN
jgi:hypothetical protein